MIHIQMAGIRNKEDALMCVEEGVDIIGLDMIVCQTVVDLLAFTAGLDELVLLENAQLMGDRGSGHRQLLSDIVDVDFMFKESIQDPDPGGITEDLEQFSQIVQFVFSHFSSP